jgi:hypothetical protein
MGTLLSVLVSSKIVAIVTEVSKETTSVEDLSLMRV